LSVRKPRDKSHLFSVKTGGNGTAAESLREGVFPLPRPGQTGGALCTTGYATLHPWLQPCALGARRITWWVRVDARGLCDGRGERGRSPSRLLCLVTAQRLWAMGCVGLAGGEPVWVYCEKVNVNAKE